MSNKKTENTNEKMPPPEPLVPQTKESVINKKTKVVRSIFNGVLGHLGLRLGETTDDEEYVALLETRRGRTLVQEVK